jgi:hypothetical protein
VTGELPVDIFSWSNGLRAEHFPPERNHLKAHVTLFHSFAPSLREELPRLLARIAGEFAPPQAEVTGLMDLGQGTAIALRSPGLMAVRERIAEHFWDMLTRQDQGGKKLHITIQNKVTRAEALALQRQLQPALPLRRFAFTGLGLHIYLGPHWEAVGAWKFRGKQGA